jgi:hypothetical protein
MNIPERNRWALPMSADVADKTMLSHPCIPCFMYRHYCPCKLSCAVMCSDCVTPVIFLRAAGTECEHAREVLHSQAEGLTEWWGSRGEGQSEGLWRVG